jgi:tetratricopeptide (TPR) repeat protein
MYVLKMRNSILTILFLITCASPAVAIPADDKEYDAAMSNGTAFKSHRHYRDALRCYEQAQRLQPGRWEPYQNVGASLVALEDFQGAADKLKQGLKLNPKSNDIYFSLGEAHAGLGDLKAAVDDLNHAIAIKPDYYGYFERRAQYYQSLRDYPHAIQDFSTAIAMCEPAKATRTMPARPLRDDIYRLFQQRGSSYVKLSKWQNAIDDFTMYLKGPARDQGRSVRVLHVRAECYDKIGKHDLAAKDRAAAENHKGDLLEDFMHDQTIGTGK